MSAAHDAAARKPDTFTIARGKADTWSEISTHEPMTLPKLAKILRQAQSQPFPTTFAEISELRAAKDAGDKAAANKLQALKHTPWFVCATFKTNKRNARDLLTCTAFVGDADQSGTTRQRLLAALDTLEVAYVVSTSTSHGCGGQERFRVVIPFATPIASEHYPAVWEWFSKRLNGMLDPGAKDPTRLNFLPRCPNGATGHEVLIRDDVTWFDPLNVIQITEGASKEAETVAPPLARQLQRRSGWTIEQLRRFIFTYCDPSAEEPKWRRVIRMLHFETNGSSEGLTLADEWSKRASNYTGIESINAKWISPSWNDPNTPAITIGTLQREYPYSSPAEFPPVTDDPGMPPSPPLIEPAGLTTLLVQKLPLEWHTAPPKKRRWIVDGYLSAETATLLISLGGLGKSYLILYLALCVALGVPFCGNTCEHGRVVILSAEDDFNEVWRRLYNIRESLALQLPPEAPQQVRENIEIVDVKRWRRNQGASPALTTATRDGVALTPFVHHVAHSIGKASLVIFDTVSRFNGAEENSNDAAARLIDAFEIISEETHSAVLALAHTGIKGKSEGANQYSSRGASAFSDNARSVMVLAPLPNNLIEKITNQEQSLKALRNDIVQLCHTKSNYSRRAEDIYFERYAHGVLIPTQLPLKGAKSEGELVQRLLERAGSGEVTRNEVRHAFAEWFGPGVTRDQALNAFDSAVRSAQLLLSSERNNSKRYRVNAVSLTGAAPYDAEVAIGKSVNNQDLA